MSVLAAPLPQETPAHQAAMQALLGGVQLGAVARAAPVREVEAQPEVEVARLWFVRVPKAPANDALTKQLHETFQANVEIVRKMNQKLGAKREIIKELRSQMTEVRSVKGAAQPEFDDKLNRLKQLREQRNTCQARISDIRGLVKGLDCKTEKELDERLKQEEEKIRFGAASLREEKQVLAELSKLRGQREKIKAYEQQKGSLVGLEAELAKIKAQIDDQDGEFSMVKGERDAASKVATGLYAKLKAVEKELEAEVAQQKEAVEKKDKVLAQLEAAKQEAEASQGDYRDNRKFSLSIREMLDRGEVEQARELCVQQTDSMMAKLLSNKGMWEDYCRALAEQRKSFVSDLLPESSTAAKAAAAEASKAAAVQPAKKAPSAKIAAAAPVVAVKPVADGTGKAKDLIASIMLQAKAEAERAIKASADAASELGSEGTSEDATSEEKSKSAPAPAAPKASAPAVAPKFVNNPAAKAAEVFGFKMEVPKVADVEMLPLPAKVEQEAKSKNDVREEQRVKATEAELRKAKRQEGLKKKKAKAVVAQSKAKEEQDLATAQAAAAAAEAEAAEKAKEAAAAQAAVVVEAEPATDAPAGPAAVVPTVSKVKKGKLAVTALDKVVAKLEVPAAKRPAAKASLVRQVKKLYVENQKLMVLLACLVLFVALLLIASM